MPTKCPNCGYEPPKAFREYNGFWKNQLPRILEMMKAGRSNAEINARFGLTEDNIFSIPRINFNFIRNKYGYPTSRASKHDRDAEIIASYQAGEGTVRELGARYNLSYQRVASLIDENDRKQQRRVKMQALRNQSTNVDDLPLTALDLLPRTLSALSWHFRTVGDVRKHSDAELLRFGKFGPTSLADWHRCLDELSNIKPGG